MMSMPTERFLLERRRSWAEVEEDLKKQELEAREEEDRIKEAQPLLEEKAAVIPDLLKVHKKNFEEFVNADVNEFDTNEDGFAREDGLMLNPLQTLRQSEVSLDNKELDEGKSEKEREERDKKKKSRRRQ